MIFQKRVKTAVVTAEHFVNVVFADELDFVVKNGKKVLRTNDDRRVKMKTLLTTLTPEKVKNRSKTYCDRVNVSGCYMTPITGVIVEGV